MIITKVITIRVAKTNWQSNSELYTWLIFHVYYTNYCLFYLQRIIFYSDKFVKLKNILIAQIANLLKKNIYKYGVLKETRTKKIMIVKIITIKTNEIKKMVIYKNN